MDKLRDTVKAEIKMRLVHAADIKPDILEHHAEMIWRHIELDVVDLVEQERQTARNELAVKVLAKARTYDVEQYPWQERAVPTRVFDDLLTQKEG